MTRRRGRVVHTGRRFASTPRTRRTQALTNGLGDAKAESAVLTFCMKYVRTARDYVKNQEAQTFEVAGREGIDRGDASRRRARLGRASLVETAARLRYQEYAEIEKNIKKRR